MKPIALSKISDLKSPFLYGNATFTNMYIYSTVYNGTWRFSFNQVMNNLGILVRRSIEEKPLTWKKQ